jgi:hypothetical protein
MDITRSACCHRLSFVNLVSCPHCGKAFTPGTLKARALAENKAFSKKIYALFLVAFIALAAVSIFIVSQHPSSSPAVSHLEPIPAFTLPQIQRHQDCQKIFEVAGNFQFEV